MPSIKREDSDALNATLVVDIKTDDYKPTFESELKKYRKHATLKGFRKGKTPISAIKKLYGRSILMDVINKSLEKTVSEYLQEADGEFIGQPIPAKDQDNIDFDPSNLEDLSFVFDIGIAPVFELKKLSKRNSFDYRVLSLPEEDVLKRLEDTRKQGAESVEVTDPVEDEDIITVKAAELDGKKVKAEGLEVEFTLFVKNTTKAVQKKLIGKNIGAQIKVDIYDLEQNTSEEMVRKYLLKLDENDDRTFNKDFRLTIEKVSRLQLEEMDEAFFEKAFPGAGISTKEEAIAKISETMSASMKPQCDALLFRDLQEFLMEKNPMSLPDEFLKRWLLISNEDTTPEAIEAGYEGFAKNLQWTLIRDKYIKIFEIEVDIEEIKEAMRAESVKYFGGARPEWMTDEMLDGMVERMMGDRKNIEKKHDELVNDKLLTGLKDTIKLKEVPTTSDELNKVIEEINAKMEQQAQLLEEEE